MNTSQTCLIGQKLQAWYDVHKRALPWRDTCDPYKIWISEIILQQTRVNQGYDYYIRFIEHFPTVESLAKSEEREVLKHWQGLGYYTRARNLHKASNQIMDKFGGRFPEKFEDILSLSGIGTYTASAICSFAYNKNYAVLDGNVFRVLSRLYAVATPINTGAGQKEFSHIAENLLGKNDPRTHNQAIMEFGALQCVPVNPNCENCPLKGYCKACKLELVNQLPVKQGKTSVSNRYFNYFFVKNGDFTYLQKRTKKDIWQNLYELPLIETERAMNLETLMQLEIFKQLFAECKIEINASPFQLKHVLSHRIIYAVFYSINITNESGIIQTFEKIPVSDFDLFPVARLTELFLRKYIR